MAGLYDDIDERMGSAYQTYMPVFKDLVSVMEFNTDKQLEKDIVAQCNKWMAQIRAKSQKAHEVNGEYVSINPAFSRRKKKHSYNERKRTTTAPQKKSSKTKHSYKSNK